MYLRRCNLKTNNGLVGIVLVMGLILSGCVKDVVPSNTATQSVHNVVKKESPPIVVVDTKAPIFVSGVTVKKSVNENQTTAITLKANDETSTVSYSIVGGDSSRFKVDPKTGKVTFLRAPDFEAKPTKNSYTFAAIAKDKAHNESSQTVIISVLNVVEKIPNKLPVAKAGKNQTVKKGSKVTLDASMSSDDGTITKYEWSEGSKKLSTKKRFTISILSEGTHTITLKVTDDKGKVARDTILVKVKGPLNEIPKASKKSVKVLESQKLHIMLVGIDKDDDKLTYSIMTNPFHGTLSGKAPNLIYVPTHGYSGKDEFTFTVNDGKASSTLATISIKVVAIKTKGIVKNGVTYNTVKSPYTGRLWLDRNLGASRVCTSLKDETCFGYYYQWGRNNDGHQIPNSATTRTVAKKINKVRKKFIKNSEEWLISDKKGAKRASNWSAIDGSSICPIGYRVPTDTELAAETTKASSAVPNNTKVFKNFLKLPSAGYRYSYNGRKDNQASYGFVWTTSAVGSHEAKNLQFDVYNTTLKESYRAFGFSVRCVKSD